MSGLFGLVAVSGLSFPADKPYTYAIPPEWWDRALPGVRVLLPFGRGNRKAEAFLLSLFDSTPQTAVKSILSVLDEAPVLTSEQLALASFMVKRYFCTFFEAARAMLPAGLWFDKQETIALTPGLPPDEVRTLLADAPPVLSLYETLLAQGGQGELSALRSQMGRSFSVCLQTLVDKGMATATLVTKKRTGDKTRQNAVLTITPEEAQAHAQRCAGRAPAQAALLRLLAEHDRLPLQELRDYTGVSAPSVTALLKKEWITLEAQVVFRRPAASAVAAAPPFALNTSQQAAADGLWTLIRQDEPAGALLHGVTGSGKTAVYITLCRQVTAQGGHAIVMVPEIALTPQVMAQFSAHFGDRVALLHSGLSLGERLDEWKRIRQGLADVVVGTRSAVFAPLTNLRLIIMDEEHDASYKSDGAPRYHARQVAKFRCVRHNALLLMGSATPSTESYHYAQSHIYHLFTLSERFNNAALPPVLLADMREEVREGNQGCLGRVLYKEIDKNITAGEQTILLLNRRGYNRSLMCRVCGYVPSCVRCSVSLTYHKAGDRLLCHHCGHSEKREDGCALCDGSFEPIGEGTQKLQEELGALFPGIEVLRMDADTTGSRGAHEKLLSRFAAGHIPILTGTQMVAKGLDFPSVTLVGVLSADASLFADDFRAHERTFSLLTQVIGRAGRGGKRGRAVIQTFTPNHPILQCAAAQDYLTFFHGEIALRQAGGLPPFSEVFVLRTIGADREQTLKAAFRLRGVIDRTLKGARVLGPAPAPVARVMGLYRYHVTLLAPQSRKLRDYLAALLSRFAADRQNRGVTLSIDVNPL